MNPQAIRTIKTRSLTLVVLLCAAWHTQVSRRQQGIQRWLRSTNIWWRMETPRSP